MLMGAMPEYLLWRSSDEDLWTILNAYRDLVVSAFVDLHRVTVGLDRELAAETTDLQAHLDSAAFFGVLLAPETTFRLLWRGGGDAAERMAFVRDSLAFEQYRTQPPPPDVSGWSVLGDFGFSGGNRLGAEWQVSGTVPVDFDSPRARAVSFGRTIANSEARPEWTANEITLLRSRLEEAWALIDSVPAAANMARTCNRVVVCQKDPDLPDRVTSGSTGQFVGRSFLTNPHLADGREAIAEGLVHEGIHGLLYMQERLKPWVDDDVYDLNDFVRSPWTGSWLGLRPFLQACFVWYGLLAFWTVVVVGQPADGGSARARADVALTGFLGDGLTDRLGPRRSSVADDVVGAIDLMQQHVLSAVARS
jgi:hypothetical protein